MSSHRPANKDQDIEGSAAALRRAARKARELGQRTNTPVYVLRRGKIVDLMEEDGAKGDGAGE
jgi:hypothetical protein